MSRVHRIPIGGGSPEGINSAYVLPDRGVVVDPGPPTDVARADLWDGIEGTGLEISDVEVVVATHWHADHAGLAPELADAANADLFLSADDAPLVSEYAAARERRLDRDARRLVSWGVPHTTVERVLDGDSHSPLPDEYPVRTLEGGATVAGLEVVPTPGHTAGHVSFLDVDSGTLFLGDAVLQRYTPNVGGGDTRMDRPLSEYVESLDRIEKEIRRAGADVSAYPGHGTELPVEKRIDEIRDHHAERTRRVLDAIRHLDGSGSPSDGAEAATSPWDVAVDLFGTMQGIHAKMGAGEAASHLAELAASGYVDRVSDSPISYEPVADRVDDTTDRGRWSVDALSE